MTLNKRFLKDMKKVMEKPAGLYLINPYESKKVLDFRYHDLKDLNERLNFVLKEQKKILSNVNRVIFYPNDYGLASIYGVAEKESEDVPILESTIGERLRFYFMDEQGRRDIRKKLLLEEKFYIYMGNVEGRSGYIYSKDKLDDRKKYWIKALRIPITEKSGSKKVIMNLFVVIDAVEYVENFNRVKKKKIKTILDLCPVRDFENNVPIYDKIETMLIRTSLIYMKETVPALNLILCGGTGSKKTAWFDSFRIIHGDDYALSQWSTTKGLIVSHFGNEAKAGLLFKAKFVAMVDEFFRRFRGDVKGTSSFTRILTEGLSDFMNIVEHKEFPFPSGKGTINLTLRSSFMATDNAIYKETIPKIWNTDQAVLRRFTFLNVSDETAHKGSSMMRPPDSNEAMKRYEKFLKKKKYFRNLNELAKFDRYCRMKTAKMKLSKKEIKYIEKIIDDQIKKHKHSFYLTVPVTTVYISCKHHAKHVKDVNKKLFEECVDRLFNDAHKVLMPDTMYDWRKSVPEVKLDEDKEGIEKFL